MANVFYSTIQDGNAEPRGTFHKQTGNGGMYTILEEEQHGYKIRNPKLPENSLFSDYQTMDYFYAPSDISEDYCRFSDNAFCDEPYFQHNQRYRTSTGHDLHPERLEYDYPESCECGNRICRCSYLVCTLVSSFSAYPSVSGCLVISCGYRFVVCLLLQLS